MIVLLNAFVRERERRHGAGSEHFVVGETDKTIRNSNVYIKKSCLGGRGAFAARYIKSGEIIEQCPAIIEKNWNKIHDTDIGNYFFSSDKSEDEKVFALGYCALFNHDEEKFNVVWEVDSGSQLVTLRAVNDIKQDEEMFVNYGPNYWISRKMVPKTCHNANASK
jgi:SET domain-containing protein